MVSAESTITEYLLERVCDPDTGVPEHLPLGAAEIETRLCLNVVPKYSRNVKIPSKSTITSNSDPLVQCSSSQIDSTSVASSVQNDSQQTGNRKPAISAKEAWHGVTTPPIVCSQVPVAPPVKTHRKVASKSSSTVPQAGMSTRSRRSSSDSVTAITPPNSVSGTPITRSSSGCFSKVRGKTVVSSATQDLSGDAGNDDTDETQSWWFRTYKEKMQRCSPLKDKLDRETVFITKVQQLFSHSAAGTVCKYQLDGIRPNSGEPNAADELFDNPEVAAALESLETAEEPPIYLNESGVPPSPMLEDVANTNDPAGTEDNVPAVDNSVQLTPSISATGNSPVGNLNADMSPNSHTPPTSQISQIPTNLSQQLVINPEVIVTGDVIEQLQQTPSPSRRSPRTMSLVTPGTTEGDHQAYTSTPVTSTPVASKRKRAAVLTTDVVAKTPAPFFQLPPATPESDSLRRKIINKNLDALKQYYDETIEPKRKRVGTLEKSITKPTMKAEEKTKREAEMKVLNAEVSVLRQQNIATRRAYNAELRAISVREIERISVAAGIQGVSPSSSAAVPVAVVKPTRAAKVSKKSSMPTVHAAPVERVKQVKPLGAKTATASLSTSTPAVHALVAPVQNPDERPSSDTSANVADQTNSVAPFVAILPLIAETPTISARPVADSSRVLVQSSSAATPSPLPCGRKSLNQILSEVGKQPVKISDQQLLAIVNRQRRINPGDRDEFYTVTSILSAARKELLEIELARKQALAVRKEIEKTMV